MKDTPIIRTSNICKSFDGTQVLKNVDFDLFPGEVHALIGENGAGKSTLMKIICGVHAPTAGTIFLSGKETRIHSPHMAGQMGIVFIHQEPLIFPDLNVTENIFAGHTRAKGETLINWNEKYRRAEELIASLNVNFSARDRVAGMSVANQQMVEIVSALSQDARVIVMDEPTAALSFDEVATLFDIVRLLKSQGRAIVFISHRLDEIQEISDRITVLRDGEKIKTCNTKDMTQDDIIKLMIGRSINEQIPKEDTDISDVALDVRNLTVNGQFNDISLTVRKGEIVGLAGLVGAGRSEVASAIFGITTPDSGSVRLNGEKLSTKNPKSAINKKIAFVPEDRQHDGLFLDFSVAENITAAAYWQIYKRGVFKKALQNKHVSDFINRFRIKLSTPKQSVKELSGGNQQKVVLSKWMLTEPDVLILDEPTRGIDIGAKAEVYHFINDMAKKQKAILMISSEMIEILGLCDRTYVMGEGRIKACLSRDEMNEERIMHAAVRKGANE